MEDAVNAFERYVEETLGITVSPVRWRGRGRVPFFLQDRYAFYEVRILETACVLMVDSGKEEQSPATIHKHMAQVQACTDGGLIYVRDRMTAYNRKRLIAQKVPFVIPGKQMYLPMLGIDLREHFRKLHSEISKFSPAAQTVLLYWLLTETREAVTPSVMAERLSYTAMTMSRAFDELEAADLGEFTTRGRKRCVIFTDQKRELWSKAQLLLRSPVKKRSYVRLLGELPAGARAGLTALAHYTMLDEPAKPVLAVTTREWMTFRQRDNVALVPSHEPEACEIEIWSYDPHLFAKNGLVDRLSLYLSLKDNQDERVEGALRQMMEGLRW